jgi:hypothetical protein
MMDDRELISGLNSAIERLLSGDPAVAVEEDVEIGIRPYVEIFALLLEGTTDPARPEFRASLRARFVGSAEAPGHHAGRLGRDAAFAAATFILGSAVNPVLARSLVASISETMGNEVAQAVSRMLDLNSDGDVASPPEETHGSPAASSSFGLSTSLLPQGALLPSPEDPPAVETPQPGSLPPGLTGEHPVQHPAPAAAGNTPAPPAPASGPPSTTGGPPANSPAAGSAPVIDPPAGAPASETPVTTGEAPPTAPANPAQEPPTTTAADPTPVEPAGPGNGKGNANGLDNGHNSGNGNPDGNPNTANPRSSRAQQGGQRAAILQSRRMPFRRRAGPGPGSHRSGSPNTPPHRATYHPRRTKAPPTRVIRR